MPDDRYKGTGDRRVVRLILYPFLAAIYSVLVLATSNSGEVIRWSDLAWPVAIAVSVVVLGGGLGLLITREHHSAALVSLLTLVAFCTYGYLAGILYTSLGNRTAARWEPALFLVVLITVVGAAYVLRKLRHVGQSVTPWLTSSLGLLLAFNGALAGLELVRPKPASSTALTPPRIASTSGIGGRPDIYLIVPDKYTGSTILKDHFGFDNTAMIAALRERGFIVPTAARANYAHTFLALAAMLNLRYLDDFPQRFGVQNTRWRDAYPLVEHNELVRLLRGHGYRFVFLPTAFGPTRQNTEADLQLPEPSEIQPEFLIAWRRTTVLPFLDRASCAFLGCQVDYLPYAPEPAALTDWKFRQLERLSLPDQPTFALAHLTVPHEPYMYGPLCEHIKPFWPAADSAEYRPQVNQAYLGQLQCVNRKLLQLVDAIMADAAAPPVILIQSDHGHGRVGRWVPPLDAATPEQIAERLSVFAAYSVPRLTESVPDTITPVNAVRMALRAALGADLPPLPDQSYWSSSKHPYDLVRVR